MAEPAVWRADPSSSQVKVEDTVGNIVTGNGTSTATCPAFLDPMFPGFVIDS